MNSISSLQLQAFSSRSLEEKIEMKEREEREKWTIGGKSSIVYVLQNCT